MVFTAIMTTVSIALILAVGLVGWIAWEASKAPTVDLDENRFAERVREACRDVIADFD